MGFVACMLQVLQGTIVESAQKQDGTSIVEELTLPQLLRPRWQPSRHNVFAVVPQLFRVSDMRWLETIGVMYAAGRPVYGML
jgi:hypothetical protein